MRLRRPVEQQHTNARRKLVAGFSLVAIVFNTLHRFDHEQLSSSWRGWAHRQSRQMAAIISITSESKNTAQQSPIIVEEDIHSSSLDVLELQDWEHDCIREGSLLIRSNETRRSRKRQATTQCKPPKHVSMLDGCESVFSSAATVIAFAWQKCTDAFGDDTNSSLASRARQFLSSHPIVPEGNGRSDMLPSTNPLSTACDVCQIVEHCQEHNLTMTLAGDSVQAQIWQGFIYELQRRNYTLSLENNQTQSTGFWKTKIQYRETLTIQTPANRLVIMHFFQIFILPFEHSFELEEVVNSGDALVLGWGMHWNSDERGHRNSRPNALISQMKAFLSFVQGKRPQLVVHREASAQHFDSHAGDFSAWWNQQNKASGCKPIAYNAKLTNWRERCIQEAAKQAGYQYTMVAPWMPPKDASTPELVALPFFNFTSKHHNQHPVDSKNDCTHYCPSPFLYMPLWRSLRLAMDRRFLHPM